VLFRASHHSAELELARRNIPFVKVGGLQFLEAAHVKDVLAVLRWAENPRSRIAGFRAAQRVPGIGAATATRLLDAMEESADPAAALQRFEPPAAALLDWQALAALYGNLRTSTSAWPEDIALVNAWYQPHLERFAISVSRWTTHWRSLNRLRSDRRVWAARSQPSDPPKAA
jgi:ATP-dependent DNA helicase UvrD/PcrA